METAALPVPFRFKSLASGSSGNAYLLQAGSDTILIDCGVGIRQITTACNTWGASDQALTAVVITHEHGDHVRALDAIRRRGAPIYATNGTADALGIRSDRFMRLEHMNPRTVGSVEILPVPTSHDAAEPTGIVIRIGNIVIGIVTDLGEVNDQVTELAQQCDLLVIESNHDREMLRIGPYPAHLKRRVAGKQGHLSNDQAAGLVGEIVSNSGGPSEIWLGHLSATNNTPEVALQTTVDRLQKSNQSVPITVLPRGDFGPTWTGVKPRIRQLQLLAE